ncbi:MAG: cation transporter, partial [Methyloprofundus sp.]|nr:cation transporter [Methyloprofundus sp.]
MAFSGWLAYYLSYSQALLLDGNFSFIIFLTTLVAIKISAIKSRRTKLFPFGQFVYEALYSLLKGVMIIGMLLAALT